MNDLINSIQNLVRQIGHEVVPSARLQDFVIHEYASYEEYKETQIKFNKIKINNIWADDVTLKRVVEIAHNKLGSERKNLRILCHGSRNGYEVQCLKKFLPDAEILGTDISDTASDYGLVEWDFHDVNSDWLKRFDVIYTNSLDQSWKPREALTVWLDQLNNDGILIIEHTEAHSPTGASKMDPFGVRPIAFPYIITKWFEDKVAISWTVGKKGNMNLEAYLFAIRNTKI
ncbi:hypothetical protein [Nereida sp. NH-UV-3]|uniref:hypothetical protein n=1 Tax=Nereida TaxID=282198 RepID=UPI0036F405D8